MRRHSCSCSSAVAGASPVSGAGRGPLNWHPERCLYLEPTTPAQRLARTDITGFGKAVDTLLRRAAGGGTRGPGVVELVGRTRQGGYRVQLYATHSGLLTDRLGTSNAFTLPSFGRWTRKPTPTSATIPVVVRGVPLSTSEDEAATDIAAGNAGRLEGFTAAADILAALKSATRLKRRRPHGSEGPPWVPSTSLRLRVDRRLGTAMLERGHLVLGYRLHTVAPYEEPLLTCFHCGREGHVAKYCRSPPRCSGCGGGHVFRECPHRSDAGPASSSGVHGGTAPSSAQ